MKTVTRTFYSDPSHAWLKVSYAELEKLGIKANISSWSYRRGDWAYLEEDTDAGVYIIAMNKLGKTVAFNEQHTNRSSKIRSYNPYYFRMAMGELIHRFEAA